MEDYVYILDFLPNGRPDAPPARREPTLLGVGHAQFTLFELVPKSGVSFTVGDKCYVGKDAEKRDIVQKIRQRVTYADLTPSAHGELPYIIDDVINAEPERFLKFFDTAPPISVRFHSLELLPGVGKKSVEHIVGEQKKGPFTSFEDLETRAQLPHPKQLVRDRVIKELTDENEKYRIFTRPPQQERDRYHHRR